MSSEDVRNIDRSLGRVEGLLEGIKAQNDDAAEERKAAAARMAAIERRLEAQEDASVKTDEAVVKLTAVLAEIQPSVTEFSELRKRAAWTAAIFVGATTVITLFGLDKLHRGLGAVITFLKSGGSP
ncbi:MAG: hypothetical protein BWX64_01444 [Acidobacteria bacterium ADurb.Bin051]|nr:MAG: hypothetical protein BWX64_01444 [Acidobacteria bacterium ADurb.Bin051]